MGKIARLELFRRLVPLCLAVFGIMGAFSFLSLLSAALCLAAAVGIYCALPRTRIPKGAVRPDATPSVLVTDAIGFGVGIPLFSIAIIGSAHATSQGIIFLMLLLLVPASMCVPIFMAAVRHETSWIRFFGNGFEVTQLGLTARVRYTDLSAMRVRQISMGKHFGWLSAFFASAGRHRVSLVGAGEETKTLVFVSKGGGEILISSEVIPDLQRVLISMDRAGVELPEGISERERKKIRRVRKRMYRQPEEPQTEQLDVARIAATVRKYREQNA
ncbi:hypothetical protein [Roseibium sp.]|uniref:hypothetical protein n=1 Tax=Roseibium sp. TaxID=1936156 RepID=UPI003A974CE1